MQNESEMAVVKISDASGFRAMTIPGVRPSMPVMRTPKLNM